MRNLSFQPYLCSVKLNADLHPFTTSLHAQLIKHTGGPAIPYLEPRNKNGAKLLTPRLTCSISIFRTFHALFASLTGNEKKNSKQQCPKNAHRHSEYGSHTFGLAGYLINRKKVTFTNGRKHSNRPYARAIPFSAE